ncbi:type III secretion inner membrane ring lipoprotein SctJ [Desulfovibrio sp. OttesenSCG-928-G11]|nr:type III secretion inner membrane ring lipoprotein SctJ [Desulfovibrio sp. OttesenSCG-928-G11]
MTGPLWRRARLWKRHWLLALCLALCLLLSACQVELYRDLTESSANEVLSALLEHGIPAAKVNLGKNGYAVEVAEEDQVRALGVLRDLGLPRTAYESLGTVFRKEGMMSSQTEERARLSYALAQEIAASCARLDGVVSANVHVVLGERDLVSGTVTPASAAVMLRYAPDAPVDLYVAQIQKMVVQSVPDVNPERVSVLLFPVQGNITRPAAPEMVRVLGLWVPSGQKVKVRIFAALIFLAGGAAGAGALYAMRRWRQTRDPAL